MTLRKTNPFIHCWVLITLALSACGPSEKKLASHYILYKESHKEQFAGDCADSFPIIPEYIAGKPDTVREKIPGEKIPCPPNEKGEVVYVDCPEQEVRFIRIRDTVKLPNTAREEQFRLRADRYQGVADSLGRVLQQTIGERDEWKEKAKKRFWIILGLLAIPVIWFIFKVAKKFL